MVRLNNDMYLYGGQSKTGMNTTVFDDFWKLDFENV